MLGIVIPVIGFYLLDMEYSTSYFMDEFSSHQKFSLGRITTQASNGRITTQERKKLKASEIQRYCELQVNI